MPDVEAATRQRVQAAVKELGYSPNVAARNLARAASLHIGLLYNNPSAAYLNELLVGVLEQSSQVGCQIVLEKCGARNERAVIDRLLRDDVGGIILPAAVVRFQHRSGGAARAAKIPFISVATGRPEEEGLSVRIDDQEAAAATERATCCRWATGISASSSALPTKLSARSARRSFETALREASVPVRPEWVKHGSFTYRSGLDAAEEILGSGHHPTAIFASNDDMAAAAMAVAHRLHLDVPEGSDRSRFRSTHPWPRPSGLRVDHRATTGSRHGAQSGRAAAGRNPAAAPR